MPPVFFVLVLPRAIDDLDEILTYIAKDSPQNAVRVIDRLWNAMHSLDQLPFRYKVHEHRRDPEKTVRSMPVPPFIVYYRVDQTRGIVRILTVRHGYRRQ